MAKKVDLDALGAQYREARNSVVPHLRVQSDAELAVVDWLNAHRGVPRDELYDRTSGEPLDPTLAGLHAAVDKAARDVAWCRAVTVAAGEAYKGCTFEDVPNGPRPTITEMI